VVTPVAAPLRAVTAPPARVRARGKFLWAGSEKLYVKGVTYGPFAPGADPQGFDDALRVDADLAAIAAAGLNTVRVYDAPPAWLLDRAADHGLHVIAGLAWEQHVAFLGERGRAARIVRDARAAVARLAGHPALLAWSIGNEIPSDVVRWQGRRATERFLRRLARAVRAADPGALVTYASYPSTEYLELPFLDFLSFNVFLEDPERLAAYVARLHNLAGERPLVLSELGLDAARNGERAQARSLGEQLRAAFDGGCAGAVVFSWTDEWHRGGADVHDWSFGLTRRDGSARPALGAVSATVREIPRAPERGWPRISVVVCSRNGAATIGKCMAGVAALDYPDFEAIVVDDGSTDATAEIVGEFPGVRLIRTAHRGLSAARNAGLAAASGELVAYLDDDARPDPGWLRYLARAFASSSHAGIGGPNIPPPMSRAVAQAIAKAPGGPVHILLTDTLAEHIPGCNMAFRRDALLRIGGFDERFRVAGDDVDVCWRLQEGGETLGFSPAAAVEHRPRTTLRGYWRQQRGYGRAEALLERKWPERYNGGGHLSWAGRVYGNAVAGHRHRRWRVYYGPQGAAPFQPAQHRPPGPLRVLALLPEWYLALVLLALGGALASDWIAWPAAFAPLAAALVATVARAGADAARAVLAEPGAGNPGTRRRWALAALLHVVQPLARLTGRLGMGLAPWRRGARGPLALPLPHRRSRWHERWRAPAEHRAALERRLAGAGRLVRSGGPYDRWDLEVRAGALGGARALLAVEEHGQGRQLVRARVRPRTSPGGLGLAVLLSTLAAVAGGRDAWPVASVLAAASVALAAWTLRDASAGVGALLGALDARTPPEAVPAGVSQRGRTGVPEPGPVAEARS
jgi:GT2 family glycosyltransferase